MLLNYNERFFELNSIKYISEIFYINNDYNVYFKIHFNNFILTFSRNILLDYDKNEKIILEDNVGNKKNFMLTELISGNFLDIDSIIKYFPITYKKMQDLKMKIIDYKNKSNNEQVNNFQILDDIAILKFSNK